MQEQTLFKIALISAIIGLVFLFLYSQTIDLKQVEHLDDAFLTEQIKINGVIESITSTNKATFLKITGSKIDTFDVILFPEEKIDLKEGDAIEITGKIEEYNGKKEIIADKIVKRI